MKNKEDVTSALEQLIHFECDDPHIAMYDYDSEIAITVLKWVIEDKDSSGNLLRDLSLISDDDYDKLFGESSQQ